MKYGEWLSEWLKFYVKPTTKMRTYLCYQDLVEKHVGRLLGEYAIEELTPLTVQRAVTSLFSQGNIYTGAGLANNTVNGVISVIKNSLKTANMLGITESYWGDRIKRPKIVEKEVNCFDETQQKRLEKYVFNSLHAKPYLCGIIVSLYTGLRLGEILALEWSDIDFAEKVMRVSKTCYYVNTGDEYGRVIDKPKTNSSKRIIPLPAKIISLLKTVKKTSMSNFVVANKNKPIATRSYQRTFQRILTALNLPQYGFHSLRHTFATRAVEIGMDVKSLSEILGHKNPSITLNRYVHSLMSHKKRMMDKISKNIYLNTTE